MNKMSIWLAWIETAEWTVQVETTDVRSMIRQKSPTNTQVPNSHATISFYGFFFLCTETMGFFFF